MSKTHHDGRVCLSGVPSVPSAGEVRLARKRRHVYRIHVAKTKMLTKLPAFAVYSAESGKQAAPDKSVAGSKARPATARKAGTPVAMQTVQEEDEYVLL